MKKILIDAKMDWSFQNLEPALKGFNYERKNVGTDNINFKKYNLIIACDQSLNTWQDFFRVHKRDFKIPVLALQQGGYWRPKTSPGGRNNSFHYYMVWGQQMIDWLCRVNGHDRNRLIITGNPKHDEFFNLKTDDWGYLLVLDDFWGTVYNRYSHDLNVILKNINTDMRFNGIIVTKHPSKEKHKLNYKTKELIQHARAVIAGETIPALWAMIMRKPLIILKGQHRGDFNFAPSYGSNTFISNNDSFVKWSSTENGAIAKVRKVIKYFLKKGKGNNVFIK